ncbi:hypothetical protein Pint_21663 [Pistacia integerrima]|uniref:Uncharacterized protein n=1 Tax=Pistacia integerrima TaxID=434235 RepID=A0ACC0XAY8_9ROSI|nr:hypothetical protein Pint_21663 [Pistacia integerrima]
MNDFNTLVFPSKTPHFCINMPSNYPIMPQTLLPCISHGTPSQCCRIILLKHPTLPNNNTSTTTTRKLLTATILAQIKKTIRAFHQTPSMLF